MIRPPGAIEALDRLHGNREAMRALREAYRREDPEWLAAADAPTLALAAGMENSPAGTLHEVRWADIAPWVRLQVLDVWASWHEGTAETCPCWPVPQRLELVVTALWRPGLVACPDCARTLLRARGDLDRTCDLCGHVVAGLDGGSRSTRGPLPTATCSSAGVSAPAARRFRRARSARARVAGHE